MYLQSRSRSYSGVRNLPIGQFRGLIIEKVRNKSIDGLRGEAMSDTEEGVATSVVDGLERIAVLSDDVAGDGSQDLRKGARLLSN